MYTVQYSGLHHTGSPFWSELRIGTGDRLYFFWDESVLFSVGESTSLPPTTSFTSSSGFGGEGMTLSRSIGRASLSIRSRKVFEMIDLCVLPTSMCRALLGGRSSITFNEVMTEQSLVNVKCGLIEFSKSGRNLRICGAQLNTRLL